MSKEQYEAFIDALLAAEKTEFKEWEKSTPYFEGCLPIEVMAERGRETLRFGPMKPVGLDDPRTGRWPYAVVQLRQDNALGTLWNMVGFQTKLKHGEQTRIFRMIPGLEHARLRAARRPASQYVPEQPQAARRAVAAQGRSALALRRADHRRRGLCGVGRDRACSRGVSPPRSLWAARLRRLRRRPRSARFWRTSPAGICRTKQAAAPRSFQPMNVNFGLFPPIAEASRGRQAPQRRGTRHRAQEGAFRPRAR